MQVEHEAANMVLEKRLSKRRSRAEQRSKAAVGTRSKKRLNVKKWLEKRKSLADVTKKLQVPTEGEVNLHGFTMLGYMSC